MRRVMLIHRICNNNYCRLVWGQLIIIKILLIGHKKVNERKYERVN